MSCICDPCESPANGAPGIAHCMACCAGSMIESYNHDCPIPEHREMAVAQWGDQRHKLADGYGPEVEPIELEADTEIETEGLSADEYFGS